ncbi:MAG: hypothetical protein IJF25_05460, partial [Oscillospiraceae bacterium]|nr:hypothetical protein [Oscillospiraceae bacterium]
CMRALGRGEILSSLPVLPDCHVLLARGGVGSSTAEAYKAADAAGFVPGPDNLVDIMESGDLAAICSNTFNRFEDTAPYAAPIKEIMLSCGALTSMLTGSGSAVFGIFNDENMAKTAEDKLGESGYWTALCRPVAEF